MPNKNAFTGWFLGLIRMSMSTQTGTKIVFFHFSLLNSLLLKQKTTAYSYEQFSPTFDFFSCFLSKLNIHFNTSIWPNIPPHQFEFGNSLLMISHPTFFIQSPNHYFIHFFTRSFTHLYIFFNAIIHYCTVLTLD